MSIFVAGAVFGEVQLSRKVKLGMIIVVAGAQNVVFSIENALGGREK